MSTWGVFIAGNQVGDNISVIDNVIVSRSMYFQKWFFDSQARDLKIKEYPLASPLIRPVYPIGE